MYSVMFFHKLFVDLDWHLMLNRGAIIKALAELHSLGALADDGKLENPAGYQMSRLPLEPVYSKALILANQFNCLEEMLITVAVLSVESIFYDPREKREEVSIPNDQDIFTFSFILTVD